MNVADLKRLHACTNEIAITHIQGGNKLRRLSEYSAARDDYILEMTLIRHLSRKATVSEMPYKTTENGLIDFNEKGEPLKEPVKEPVKEQTEYTKSQEEIYLETLERNLVSIAKGIWTKLKESRPKGSERFILGFPTLCEYASAANKAAREGGFDINKYWRLDKDGRAYLIQFGVQAKLSMAVAIVMKERPANPIRAIVELLRQSRDRRE